MEAELEMGYNLFCGPDCRLMQLSITYLSKRVHGAQLSPPLQKCSSKEAKRPDLKKEANRNWNKDWKRGWNGDENRARRKESCWRFRDVLIELLEEQFGHVTSSLAEKLDRVQSYDVLVSLRRRRKHCHTIEEFESLVERAMQ
jgi:hypothetical protein